MKFAIVILYLGKNNKTILVGKMINGKIIEQWFFSGIAGAIYLSLKLFCQQLFCLKLFTKKIPLSGQAEKGDFYFDLASPLQAGERVLVMG